MPSEVTSAWEVSRETSWFGSCEVAETLIAEAGLEVTEEAQSLALRHLDWVLEQNLTLNLTSVKDPAEAIRLHTVDSLMVLGEIDDGPEGTLVDLGSGAGFPGIPLAIASRQRALLVDSVGKKARAVEQFLRGSGLERTHRRVSETRGGGGSRARAIWPASRSQERCRRSRRS